MYIHELPTTGAISFSDFLITSNFVSQVAEATELRAKLRTVLKQNRAGEAKSDDGTKDWLRIVKAVEEYLPHLFAIFNCIQTDDLILRYEPEFSWRTTLSSSFLRSPPRITLSGIYYEICNTLLLSGAVLSNFAASAVSSLGAYELDRKPSDAERKAKDDRLRWAADMFCRASGIFEHLSKVVIPQWENHAGKADGRPPDITREVTMALAKLSLAEAQTLAIRKLLSPSLAYATDTITPGPPLPKSHPSPSLLAKLHLNVASLYESALSLAKTVGKRTVKYTMSEFDPRPSSISGVDSRSDSVSDNNESRNRTTKKVFGKLKSLASRDSSNSASTASLIKSPTGGMGNSGSGGTNGGISSSGSNNNNNNNSKSLMAQEADLEVGAPLLRYLSASAALHKALAYKWLGVDAGEADGRIGDAIAFLRMAKDGLSDSALIGGNKLTTALRERGSKESMEELKAFREQQLESILHYLKSYTKLNDTVSFQPIPRASDLQSKIPAGRAALECKAYQIPVPAFGPGSPGYLSDNHKRFMHASSSLDCNTGVESLSCLSIEHHHGGAPLDEADRLAFASLSIGKPKDDAANYAGAGAYY